MTFKLNRNKLSLRTITIILVVIVSISFAATEYTHTTKDNSPIVMHNPSLTKTSLYAEIINPRLREKSLPQENVFTPKTVTPSTIIRGNSFLVTGRLEDPGTGL